RQERTFSSGCHLDEYARAALPEQRLVQAPAPRQQRFHREGAADSAYDTAFDERDQQSPFAAVVSSECHAPLDRFTHQSLHTPLEIEIERRWCSRHPSPAVRQVLAGP